MNLMIHQILLLFFIFPVIIHSKNSCPISICSFRNNNLQIQYPFKLQTDPPPKGCYNFINLRCNDQGHVVINLPSIGDFYVTSIDYVLQNIALSDPANCLLGRLMMPYVSPYPLEAYFYKNYTYYTCPKERITPPFTEIHCLSNSINATIATTVSSMNEKYGCTPIGSSMIPVSWSNEYNNSGNFGDLQLTWNVRQCRECYDTYVFSPPSSDGSKSKMTKVVRSPIFITTISLLATFSGIACVLRLTTAIADTATTDNTTVNNTAEDTVVAPPQAIAGTENSQVKSFTEVEILGESQGTLVSCSICLEEYNGKDKVRNLDQCGHYFHVECIDQWLHRNSSCPVCRTSLS